MPEAPPLSEDEYAEFYEIDEPVIQFAEGVNEIQHVQPSMVEVAEEQAKDKVWREVISWVEQGCIREKKVKQERFWWYVPCSIPKCSR